MAVFVRPATWSYDLPLFRAATGDEQRLEELLAAIALDDQRLWVAESPRGPAAFVHAVVSPVEVGVRLLFVRDGEHTLPLLQAFLERFAEEFGDGPPRLVVPSDSLRGVSDEDLAAVGFECESGQWRKSVGGR